MSTAASAADTQNVEYLIDENSPECSTADTAPSPAVNHTSTQSPPSCHQHVTPSSVARQLYQAQMNTSRCSSLSDTVYDDIDGSFIELNDKVKMLEEKVRELTESQQRSNERQTKMKDENVHLVRLVHVLEEQLRDVEVKAREQLAEEQRKHHELLMRSDKDKTFEIELLAQSLQRIEQEYSVLKTEAPSLRSDNERLRKENGRQCRDIDELQQKLTDLTDEHKSLQDHVHSEQLQMSKERTVHSQLLDELTRELDELRYFKAELMAKSPSQRSDLSRSHRCQLEERIAQLKLENISLREQIDELQAQLLHRHVVEGRALLENNKSLAAEIDSLSIDELKDLLSKEQEANGKLRDYIERITLRILEKNPSILEI
jgi:Rab11 family-interacting protein 3/4